MTHGEQVQAYLLVVLHELDCRWQRELVVKEGEDSVGTVHASWSYSASARMRRTPVQVA